MHNGMLGRPRGGNQEALTLKIGPRIGFSFAVRYGDTGLTVPVPTLRPLDENSAIGLDITPRGPNPVESVGNGFAWIDVGDKDVRDSNFNNGVAIPNRWARVAMTSTGAQFGQVTYNGASALPIEFLVDNNTVKARLSSAGFQYGSATRAPVARIEATDDTIVSFLNVLSGEGLAGTITNHPFSIWTNNTKRLIIDSNLTMSSGYVAGTNIYATGGSLLTLQTVDTTNRSTTSTSFVASGVISPSLTPTSSSNKVLINVCGLTGAAGAQGAFFTLYRSIGGGAYSAITPGGSSEMQGFVIPDANSSQAVSFSILDSPATTSAVLYQVYFRSNAGTTIYLGRRGADTLFNSPTAITVTEIKG